jgi:hypothetical protein
MKYLKLTLLLIISMEHVFAQDVKPEATEDWSNKPPIVTPGTTGSPPSDAIVLFADERDLAKWEKADGTAAKWEVKKEVMQIVKDAGDIQSKLKFGSIQLHLEWMTPEPAEDESTSRGNSGVFLMGLYELQIYESYNYNTRLYYNGMAGSIYKQYTPEVNACRPPQTWQSYDVIFEAPVFHDDKTLKTPAYMTVIHNGVLIQNHVELKGPMVYAGYPKYRYHESKLPLRLQEHDSRVSFRNIWVRELKGE